MEGVRFYRSDGSLIEKIPKRDIRSEEVVFATYGLVS